MTTALDTVKVGEIEIAYAKSGAGEQVILLHGGESTHSQYDTFRPLLGDGIRAIAYDQRDSGASVNVEAQKKILFDQFAECRSWKVQTILDAVRADPDIYFDSVSQIHMLTWHRGRVALVGDAAHCASPLAGRGTSLAMTGPQFLAEELERSDGDHVTAFSRYEARQRPYVEFAQGTAESGGALLVPPTQEAIVARNQLLQPVAVGQ